MAVYLKSNLKSKPLTTYESPMTVAHTAPTWLSDGLGRPLQELRISVTDRCNLRCVYCMPREQFAGFAFAPRAELLRFEEIARVASVLAGLGVRKVRLTGGEPLLRRELPVLVGMLAPLGVELALTTNGLLLDKLARPLAEAGLTRATVSLDALDPWVFRQMSDSNASPDAVLAGIEAAKAAGLSPIKINCVVRRGLNDDQIVPLAEHFRGSGHVLRFIEYMDVGETNGWNRPDVVPAAEILQRLRSEWPLTPLAPAIRGEPARRYQYADGMGEVGIIASVTSPFCGDCTRLRLSAIGELHTCLFSSMSTSVRDLLRAGASDDELAHFLRKVWRHRVDRYSELRTENLVQIRRRPEMSALGG